MGDDDNIAADLANAEELSSEPSPQVNLTEVATEGCLEVCDKERHNSL